MSKLFVLVAILFLSFGIFSVALANTKNLSGYIYSQTAGWISLNCENTNSCDNVEYGVSQELTGYGFSQTGEWININPNYGGLVKNSDGSFSGWVFGEKNGWIRIESSKIISAENLQKEIINTKNVINDNNLSSDNIIALINSLCYQFLSDNECSIIGN